MPDSEDSDYNVEDFVKPDTVRRTYDNKDDISDNDDEGKNSNGSGSEEEAVEDDQGLKNCTQNEGTENGGEKKPTHESAMEPVRTNSRFILYVTNLSGETTRSMLEDFFMDAGNVKSIRIPKVRLGNFAFVEMQDFEGFKNGLKFNNKELDGRKIQVYEGSKNKKHASNKSKNLKRKTQQKHLSDIKMRKKNMSEQI